MKEIIQQTLSGERALYGTQDARISFCTFADGESPLKESSNLEIWNGGKDVTWPSSSPGCTGALSQQGRDWRGEVGTAQIGRAHV